MIKYLSRFALKYGLMPVAHYLVRAYLLLIKIRVVNEEISLQHLKSGQKMIVAIWHQRILVVTGYARRFGGYKPSVMISRSRDGEMIAKVYSRFNFRPIRGSSSRGGKEALANMVEDLVHQSTSRTHPGWTEGPQRGCKAWTYCDGPTVRRTNCSGLYLS